VTRAEVIAVMPCPNCGALVGEPCRGQGPLHPKRVGRAEMLLGWRDRAPDAERARLLAEWRYVAVERGRRRRGRG
jgi:hypothetical protein